MQKFDQTTFSDHAKGQYGDCMRACVYTLLGEDIDLPHPIAPDGFWNQEFFDDLQRKTGKYPYPKKTQKLFPEDWPKLVIRAGKGPRGHNHAVVWDLENNEMYHDPHPSRDGLVTFERWYVLK